MSDFLDELQINKHKNIKVIRPEEGISTYALIDASRAVLIYNTKTGIEASYRKKPVITAGEAWIKGKGISFDAYSAHEYLEILERFADEEIKMSESQICRAEKYAHHFFFKRMIRLQNFVGGKYLVQKEGFEWISFLGYDDPNFGEILDAIEENRTPYSKVI